MPDYLSEEEVDRLEDTNEYVHVTVTIMDPESELEDAFEELDCMISYTDNYSLEDEEDREGVKIIFLQDSKNCSEIKFGYVAYGYIDNGYLYYDTY